jgi:non-specific serine/threonine protein kinase
VLDLLLRLVDKSLVVVEPGREGIERYHLLETLRYYARERLAASGEAETIYRRHADYYLTLAEQAAQALRGPEQRRWLERLEEEHDNLRVALEWWTSTGDAERGLRLGAALELFWFMRGHCGEGLARLLELLAFPSTADGAPGSSERARARANALYGAGYLAYTLGDLEQARALRTESLAIGRRIGDKRIVAYALRGLAASAAAGADYPLARAQYEESLVLFRALDDRWGIAYALYRLGLVTFAQGDLSRARPLFEEGLVLAQQDGDSAGIARCLNRLGLVEYLEGDYATARARFEEGLAIGEALGFAYAIGVSLRGLARVALDESDPAAAGARFRASLAIHQNLGVPAEVASALEGLSGVAASMGQPERALRLAGAADAKRRDLGRPLEPALRVVLDRWLAPARRDLSKEMAEAAWVEGQNLAIELAIAQAMGGETD